MNSDIKITYDNKDYYFQLAVGKESGQKQWEISDTAVQSPMFTSDTPKLSQIPAEREIVIEQKYFHGGMGEEFHAADSTRYYKSPGCDARRRGAVLLGPKYAKATTDAMSAPVINITVYGGHTWASADDDLLKWNTATSNWDVVHTAAAAITDMCVWSAYLIIAQGFATDLHIWNGSSVVGSVQVKPKYVGTVGSTLWGSFSDYTIKSSTNPLAGGSWSGATTVGSTNTVITDILSHPDTVLVATRDAFYEIGSVVNTNLLPELLQESDTNTGINSVCWHSSAYVASGTGNLWEYDLGSDIITSLPPAISVPGQADFVGRIMAMDGDPDFLYVLMDYATKVELLAGRWVSDDFIWHHLAEITLTDASGNIKCARISNSDSVKKLWLGCSDESTDGIYYVHSPAISAYGDLTSDTDYQFQTSGDFYTGWLRGAYLYDLKTFYSIEVRTADTTATETIIVSYRLKDGDSFTALGTITTDVIGDPIIFPLNIIGTKIQLKFTFASGASTATPQLIDFTLYALARPFGLDTSRVAVNDEGEFTTYGGQFTNWRHSEYPNVLKNWYSLSTLSSGLTAAKYISWQWRIDDDADWNPFVMRATKSPYDIAYFPSGTVGRILYVKPDKYSPTDTEMIGYIVSGELRPTRRKKFNMALQVARELALPGGGAPKRQDVDTVLKALRAIDTHSWPVILETFDGQIFNVTLKLMKEQLIGESSGKNREYLIQIQAVEQTIE